MPSIKITPAVLRALAEGCERLNDGDMTDDAALKEVELLLYEEGYFRSGLQWVPVAQAYWGYVPGMGYKSTDYNGNWNLPAGTHKLYLDLDCTLFLREITVDA